jgi:hypothetical protein
LPIAQTNVFKNFQNTGSVAPATNSRLAPLNAERADYGFGATVDIPLDASTVCVMMNEFVEIPDPSLYTFVNLLDVLFQELMVS